MNDNKVDRGHSNTREEWNNIKPQLTGWGCIKCGSVYSPYVSECPTCKNGSIRVITYPFVRPPHSTGDPMPQPHQVTCATSHGEKRITNEDK